MNILNQCIGIINDRLFNTQLTDNCFQNRNVYGLTYQSVPTNDNPIRPFYYWNNETRFVDVTDERNTVVYHRLQSVDFVDNTNIGFGDGNGLTMAKFNLWMVFYSNTKNINYSQDDMILKTSAAFNYTFASSDVSVAGLRYVRSSVQRVNPNSLQVFQGEYGVTANCPLQFGSSYFGVQYTIDIHATNECLACQTC